MQAYIADIQYFWGNIFNYLGKVQYFPAVRNKLFP